jgi:hypothetical protein
MEHIGLIFEEDFIKRYPTRRQEILTYAIKQREERKVLLQESHQLLTWHPVHAAKVILVTGALAFVLAFLVSQIVSIGHWYASAKSWIVPVSLPVIGTKDVDLGTYVPTSTSLAVAGRVPSFGLRESIIFAIAVMVLMVLEKVAMSLVHWKKARLLQGALRELDDEIRTLHDWLKHG